MRICFKKGVELCNELRSLGSALLSALEKKEAEERLLLRTRHEIILLKLIGEIKEQQIEETNETLQGSALFVIILLRVDKRT
jgi:hypothetical protein